MKFQNKKIKKIEIYRAKKLVEKLVFFFLYNYFLL